MSKAPLLQVRWIPISVRWAPGPFWLYTRLANAGHLYLGRLDILWRMPRRQ